MNPIFPPFWRHSFCNRQFCGILGGIESINSIRIHNINDSKTLFDRTSGLPSSVAFRCFVVQNAWTPQERILSLRWVTLEVQAKWMIRSFAPWIPFRERGYLAEEILRLRHFDKVLIGFALQPRLSSSQQINLRSVNINSFISPALVGTKVASFKNDGGKEKDLFCRGSGKASVPLVLHWDAAAWRCLFEKKKV